MNCVNRLVMRRCYPTRASLLTGLHPYQPRGLEDGVGLDVLGRSVKPYAAKDTDEQGYDHNEGGEKSCQGFHFLDHS